MNKCSRAIGVVAVLLAGTAACPSVATAASRTMSSAADIVSELEGQGYDVQLNGQPNGALAQCTVTGVHQTAKGPAQFGTAYIDLDCPGDD
jgi:hypothetical protein